MESTVVHILFVTLQLVAVPLLAPLATGVIATLKARLQNKRGASVFQPYRNLFKLFQKDEIISRDASWVFCVAPFILFGVTLVVSWGIPVLSSFSPLYRSDILLIVYTFAIGTFFLALAGLDTGSPFGGFGSGREMTLAALAEGGFLFSLLTLALICGSTDVTEISLGIEAENISFSLPMLLTAIGFFLVLLAENGRFPFDNPATHLELTMIHEAMILEYSGKRLALIEWAAANKLLLFITLMAQLLFPWGIAQEAELLALCIAFITYLFKVFLFCMAIAFIESVIAKFRFFRLPDLLFVSFILNAIAIGLI